MNWEILGVAAEIVGATAVVVSLVYLTVQLKQNTQAMKSATIDSLNKAMVSNIQMFIEDDDVLELMMKANANEELSEKEEAKYYYLLLMLVRRFEGFYFQRTFGFVDPQMTAGYEHSMLSIIGRNQTWWQQAKKVMSPDFIAFIDKTIAEDIPEAVHPGFDAFRDQAPTS